MNLDHHNPAARPDPAVRPGQLDSNARSVSELALRWLDENREGFSNFPAGHIPSEAVQCALCELALFLIIQRRYTHPPDIERRLDRLGDILHRAYARPEFHQFIETGHPLAATGHIFLWLACHHRGVEDFMPRSRLVAALEERKILSQLRNAMRLAELRLALDQLDYAHTLPGLEEFNRVSQLPDLLRSSAPPALYEATHWIFYLSDYGRVELPHSPDLVNSCGQRMDELITDKHWDLVAEFILAPLCLSRNPPSWIKRGWQALAGAQSPQGDFRDPDADPAITPRFLRQYHKCLVTAWAGLTQLSGNSDPKCATK